MQSLNAHEPYVRRAPCRRAVAMIRPNTPGRNSIQNEQWEGGNLDALLNRLFEQTAYVCARCWMAFVDLMLTSSARADSTCRLRPMRRRSRSSIDSSGKAARATAPCARTTSRPTTRSCRCPASTTFIKTACYHGSSEYVVLLAAWILVSDIHSHSWRVTEQHVPGMPMSAKDRRCRLQPETRTEPPAAAAAAAVAAVPWIDRSITASLTLTHSLTPQSVVHLDS